MLQTNLEHRAWHAHLQLELAPQAQRTIITRRHHHGPLVIQKPFYPEGGTCHIYLLHPPGGLVGGDVLSLQVKLRENSHCLITTPGATKFYRSDGTLALQQQHFSIADQSLLEWLPQEAIAFNQTRAQMTTRIDMTDKAKFIGWEITCLGRRASQEAFSSGHFLQKLELYQATKPLLIERALFQGDHNLLHANWGLANHATVGTMIIAPGSRDLLNKIRTQVKTDANELFSATLMDNILVCRYLGPQAYTAKNLFTKVWQIARPAIQNVSACIPRIWNT